VAEIHRSAASRESAAGRDRLLERRADHTKDLALAAKRSSQHDESVIVLESPRTARVHPPAVLVAQVARPFPPATALEPNRKENGQKR
jgi:hypothetical protein